MSKELLPEPLIEKVAQRFKVLSEPIRLQLLNQLQTNGEMNVQELMEATGHRQATVSKHLGLMAREGILKRRKEGLHVYYDISDPSISGLCMLVCARLREEIAAQNQLLNSIAEE